MHVCMSVCVCVCVYMCVWGSMGSVCSQQCIWSLSNFQSPVSSTCIYSHTKHVVHPGGEYCYKNGVIGIEEVFNLFKNSNMVKPQQCMYSIPLCKHVCIVRVSCVGDGPCKNVSNLRTIWVCQLMVICSIEFVNCSCPLCVLKTMRT